jgi:rhodanese-related sulfurtransferase
MATRCTLLILCSAVCCLSGCTVGLNDNYIVFVGGSEVRALMDEAAKPGRAERLALVDPRSAEEFAAGHLPGAIHLEPIQHGQKPPRRIRDARNVIVYGVDPGDALARGMTKRLMESGVERARLYAGGLREWASAGQPIEPPGANPFPRVEPLEVPIEATSGRP